MKLAAATVGTVTMAGLWSMPWGGAAPAQAAVTCDGLNTTIVAGPGTPYVSGTAGADVIVVTGTGQWVFAGAGDDRVCVDGTGIATGVG